MTIESFQRFVEMSCPSACVPVDLVKIARNVALSNMGPRVDHDFRYQPPEFVPSPLCLVMDGECCLDRLYGGFFGDWVCGGQWNRMADFLATFVQALSDSNIEMTVFFNGASESDRLNNWVEKQKSEKEKISQVLRHVTVKGTPPPKVWWVPPSGLRTYLRILLRQLKVNVVMTHTDHHQEVMEYLKRNNYHGLLADDPDYIIMNPPRYFSAVQLKLTFKGCLETKEYILNEVTRCLNLHPSRICLVASLLGNHIITVADLAGFHRTICSESKGKVTPNTLIKAVVDYVRNLSSVDDLDEVSSQVFESLSDERCKKLKDSIHYYNRYNGSAMRNINKKEIENLGQGDAENYHEAHGKQISINKKHEKVPLLPTPGCGANNNVSEYEEIEERSVSSQPENSDSSILKRNSGYVTKFASEGARNKFYAHSILKVLTENKHKVLFELLKHEQDNCSNASNFNVAGNMEKFSNHKDQNYSFPVNSNDSNSVDSEMNAKELKTEERTNHEILNSKTCALEVPKVSAEVMKCAFERHVRGLMHPHVYQLLAKKEIKIPVTFEDELTKDMPSPGVVYRPMRQMMYALLFNHHHLHYLAEQRKEKEGIEEEVPEIIVKEWVWKKGKGNKFDNVPSIPLGWAVPTIARLWFGTGPEDDKKRLQAFLTCMRSNNVLISDQQWVPPHLIILATVLRYLLTSPEMPFIQKCELDALIAQAVDTHLTDVEHTQKLELPVVTSRGIQLAALFMQGVEHAILVNDACGAPISWELCCPWLFFDGKLFHRKLLRAGNSKNILDVCENKYEEAAQVDQVRKAILEGINVKFLPPQFTPIARPSPPSFTNFPLALGRGRGHQRVVPRGGQLEVAGVVVGSWGPNYGQGPRSPSRTIPPQVVSVGGIGRGRGALAPLARMPPPPGRTSQGAKVNPIGRGMVRIV